MRGTRTIGAVALLASTLLLVSCSGDDDAEEPAAGDEAVDATTTSASSTTTAPIPEGGESIEGVQLTAVVFGDAGHVSLTNNSDAAVSLEGSWVCNQPGCVALSGTLAPGEPIDVPAAELGGLPADGGEAGLYVSEAFDSPDAMADYVQWGSGGQAASVAVAAGLWPEGVTVEPLAELIELFGVPGDPESWS